jgi:hypothetical protein
MVMIGFRDIQGRPIGEGVTSILQGVIWVGPKRLVTGRATLGPSYASCTFCAAT